MIGKTQSNCGCPNVSNSAQSLGRHGHSFIWGEPFLFGGRMRTTPFISLLKGLGSACVRRWEPPANPRQRSRLPHPKLKGPITVVDVMRRETVQLSMPFER